MESLNPFAPPKSEVLMIDTHSKAVVIDRQKGIVFVPNGSDLPSRCLKCNAPARLPIKSQTFYWHSPWYFLLLLLFVVVYLIVAVIVQKKFKLSICLCEKHHKQHQWMSLLWTLARYGLFALMLFSFSQNLIVLGVILAVALLIGVFVIKRKLTLLQIVHIKAEGAQVKGFGEAFLEALNAQSSSTSTLSHPPTTPS